MKSKKLKFIIIFVISVAVLTLVPYFILHSKQTPEEKAGQEIVDKQALKIEQIIKDRQANEIKIDENVDPFGEDGIVRVLVLGLDSRAGQTAGHCDVIQMIEINKNTSNTIPSGPRPLLAAEK